MGKRKHHQRRPKKSRPESRRHPARHGDDAPDFIREVAEAAASPDPLDLIGLASSVLTALDPRSADPFAPAEEKSQFGRADFVQTPARSSVRGDVRAAGDDCRSRRRRPGTRANPA